MKIHEFDFLEEKTWCYSVKEDQGYGQTLESQRLTLYNEL